MSAQVNRPTNVKQKEQDVNQKLQLYGIFEAFSNGKVPTNRQIDIAMNSVLQKHWLTHPSKRLSREGQELVGDLRDVIEKAKTLLLVKNEGNLLQDFIWQCQHIDGGSAGAPGSGTVSTGEAKRDAEKTKDSLKDLGQLIISNGQFRKLINDAFTLLRDMGADAASKVADKARPDQEDLDQIDEPEDDNTWHDTPDLGQMKNKVKSAVNNNTPNRGDMQEAKDKAQQHGQSGGIVQGLKAGAQTMKNKQQENMDDDDYEQAQQQGQEIKQKAREKKDQVKEDTKGYLKEKVPKERREQAVYRLKKMIVEIQGHPDYQSAINTILDLLEKYKHQTKKVAAQTADATHEAHQTDGELQTAEQDLKVLLERFANCTSSDDLIEAFDAIYSDAERDPEFKSWFKRLDTFIKKSLKKQGYVLTDEADSEWERISDQGEFLLKDRYRNHTDRLADEFKFMGEQFDKDPMNTAFADSLKTLFTNLGNDENGKPTFKPHLVKDLSEVIVPAIFENIRYVPIPRIEYSDPMMDAIVENLVIEGDNLTPNILEFASDNHFKWGRKSFHNRNKNKVMLAVSGIQMDLKDVAYYIHKKTGFPSITDKGVVDIFMGGSGFSFKAALETADPHDQHSFFKVNTVDVDVKNMNIKLKQSNHKTLFNIFKPLLLKVMTPAITKVLEKVIKEKINQLDDFCYDVKKEVDRAQARVKNNPEEASNIYQQYFNAAQKKLTQKKKQAEEASADKKVNVAVTKQDSMFKNISLPGGISTKATEYKNMAASGTKWESPIFSIGSAKESTSLPRLPAIKRKEHAHAPSKIRGPKNLGQSQPEGPISGNKGQSQGQGGNYGSSSQQGYGGDEREYGTAANYPDSHDYNSGYGQGAAYSEGYGASQGRGYNPYDSNNSQSYGQNQSYGQDQSYGQGQNYAETYPATRNVGGYQDVDSYGVGQANGSASGFSNQVKEAFDGNTGLASGGHTVLGTHNPVLQGRV